jgi:hypothetical protein
MCPASRVADVEDRRDPYEFADGFRNMLETFDMCTVVPPYPRVISSKALRETADNTERYIRKLFRK